MSGLVGMIAGARRIEYRQFVQVAAVTVAPGITIVVPDALAILLVYANSVYTASAVAGNRFFGWRVWDGVVSNVSLMGNTAIAANAVRQSSFGWQSPLAGVTSGQANEGLPVVPVLGANQIGSNVVGPDPADTIGNVSVYFVVWLA